MELVRLDDDTVRQIAAGEVVERPASVVKELVENSLDAGASRIDVEVVAGGKERVTVADDGDGMTREEARLAVRQHTTSKIADASDLTAGIGTLGFRGEALYAIGAVSSLAITTRPPGGDEGTAVTVERGEVVDVAPAGRAPGTTVEVTDLFDGTPARAKFLASDATEFDHVNRIVSRYALANPDVAVSLRHDGREVFATTGRGDLLEAVLAVYGREVAESMQRIEGDGVTGAVSHPETTRSTREYVSTFVNGRFVVSSDLRGAVVEAYGHQLAPDRYPFAVVFVSVEPGAVDVNVHPRKLEVRFDDATSVRDRVRTAVEAALLSGGLLRSGAPRGRSAPPEVEPAPPARSASASTDAGSDADDGRGDDASAERTTPTDLGSGARPAASSGSEPPDWLPAGRVREPGTQTTLGPGPGEESEEYDRLPALRVLGQIDGTYLVCETDRGLVIVDQHAADERVHYERLAAALDDEPGTQALAEPVELELTAGEAALFPSFVEALAAIGFRVDRIGERTLQVSAVPAALGGVLDATLVRDVIAELSRAGEANSVDARADALLADLACHPAVTAHTSLTDGSVRALLEALDACENPYACPHGRPTMIEVSAAELADRFERDYPGHAGRRDER